MEHTFGNFLKGVFHKWRGSRLPEMPSQADFAVYLGVPTTNLSTWMSDQKKPGPEYIDLIADKLARGRLAKRAEVYAAAGVPPRMPADKKFSLIARVWDIMPEQMQNQWYEIAQNIASEDKEHNGGELA